MLATRIKSHRSKKRLLRLKFVLQTSLIKKGSPLQQYKLSPFGMIHQKHNVPIMHFHYTDLM